MRCAVAILVSLFTLIAYALPASATMPDNSGLTSSEAVTRFISGYRLKPEPARLPEAVRAMSQLGAFKDTESSGVYVGFIAGVLGDRERKSWSARCCPSRKPINGRSSARSPIRACRTGRA